jgi:cellulose synthase/poly-beta-1,6-N-acetylglucosamine synthase-like glycosyltransferase
MSVQPKVVVVMPAYNAGRTLRMTYEKLPKDMLNLVILVDDGSTDATLEIARELGLEVFVHDKNYGYGANQRPVTPKHCGPPATSWSWCIRITSTTPRSRG